MNFTYLQHLRKNHPAWKLLSMDMAPLVISFLHRTFIEPHLRAIPQTDLREQLDDYLYHIRELYGEETAKRSAQEYLENWCDSSHGFLRKFYVENSDEPVFDLTSAAEKGLVWVDSLKKRQFIGTESRLLYLFQLLRDLVYACEEDPLVRISELEKEKKRIDQEIKAIREGRAAVYDKTQIEERFFHIEDHSRQLLSDFRQVEENFRSLDKQVREKIAISNTAKGKVLDEIFQEADAIEGSDQGKSFQSFWSFLMSPDHQEEFAKLTTKILTIEPVPSSGQESILPQLKHLLVAAGSSIKKNLANLNEQLRRYLNEQTILENRRIADLIHSIEKKAIDVREAFREREAFHSIANLRVSINLPLARKLFVPTNKALLKSSGITEQRSKEDQFDILYATHFVDSRELTARIRTALADRIQISLGELVRLFPISKGVSEVVTYLHLAGNMTDLHAFIDRNAEEEHPIYEKGLLVKKISIPKTVFSQ